MGLGSKLGAKPVEIVSWGEDYTVKLVSGWGDKVDFEIYKAGVGDPAYAFGGCVDKVRIIDGIGERPRYQVKLVG